MDFKDALKELKEEYNKQKEETPWYHNTGFCQVVGSVDELESLTDKNIDNGSVGCYLVGRIDALEELKRKCIFE